MNSEKIIEMLGGPSEVARLCECSPQAVSQWFGPDPVTGIPREIPNARLLFLKAVRPDVFKNLTQTQDVSVDAPLTADPALAAELIKAEQAGIVKLTKQPIPWVKEERRIAREQRRAIDRAKDDELETLKAAGKGA